MCHPLLHPLCPYHFHSSQFLVFFGHCLLFWFLPLRPILFPASSLCFCYLSSLLWYMSAAVPQKLKFCRYVCGDIYLPYIFSCLSRTHLINQIKAAFVKNTKACQLVSQSSNCPLNPKLLCKKTKAYLNTARCNQFCLLL